MRGVPVRGRIVALAEARAAAMITAKDYRTVSSGYRLKEVTLLAFIAIGA